MANNTDHLAGGFETENTGGVLSGFLAEEDEFDRRALWRLGSWGVATVRAVVLAVLANQSSIGWRRDQVRGRRSGAPAQQIQSVAKDSLSEAKRLALAIDTLNGDRDRLFSRVTNRAGFRDRRHCASKHRRGAAAAGSRLAGGRDRSGAGQSAPGCRPRGHGGGGGGGGNREAAGGDSRG